MAITVARQNMYIIGNMVNHAIKKPKISPLKIIKLFD